MPSVASLAAEYGTSTTFIVKALGQVGFDAAIDGSDLPADVLVRFETEFGARIRRAKSTTVAPVAPAASRVGRERPPLRAAYEKVDYHRNLKTMDRYKTLPDNPDVLHALDTQNTREGDPWERAATGFRSAFSRAPGDVVYFGHQGPRAACGARVLAMVENHFEVDSTVACAECAERVRDGSAIGRFRQPDRDELDRACRSSLRRVVDGQREVLFCCHWPGHDGQHRDSAENEWSDEEQA